MGSIEETLDAMANIVMAVINKQINTKPYVYIIVKQLESSRPQSSTNGAMLSVSLGTNDYKLDSIGYIVTKDNTVRLLDHNDKLSRREYDLNCDLDTKVFCCRIGDRIMNRLTQYVRLMPDDFN